MAGTGQAEQIRHRNVSTNGIRLHIAEQGEGPLVVLLHGFPESWYSWRPQIAALADAGFHVVAPDQRGFGRSECPADPSQFTIMHLVGDVIGLIAELGEESAIVIAHDWGAPVAWATALMRPDVVRGVVGISVPPDGPFLTMRREAIPPVRAFRERLGDSFYIVAFQEPGVAEGLLNPDIHASFRGMWAGTESEEGREASFGEDSQPAQSVRPLPDWTSPEDVDAFAAEYAEHGFTGGLNWYRNMDRNWELMAPWAGAVITPPSLYLIGDQDNVPAFIPVPGSVEELREVAPAAREIVTVPGAGHWTQRERPDFVSKTLVEFARSLA